MISLLDLAILYSWAGSYMSTFENAWMEKLESWN